MPDDISKRIFLVSALFLAALLIFFYGMAVVKFRVWPYPLIDQGYMMYKSLVNLGKVAPSNRLFKAPAGAARTRFTFYRPALQLDGYYALLGWDDENNRYSAWLYDREGHRLHTWALDYNALDPDGPLNGIDAPHAFAVLPDGSIMVSFDHGDVMARLDRCGNTVWKKPGVYHHSLQRANDGSYWTWRSEGTPDGQYHYLENFDPDTGRTLREIGLVEDIIKHLGPQAMIFGVRPDHDFLHFEKTPENKEQIDIFHPNDVDVLTDELAPAFPEFRAGDLLLSFRTLHLVAVLDPQDLKIRWWSHGPWRFQHDPDFTADGKISVFSNNTGGGRSEIIRMDPVTREVSNDLFSGDVRFYTNYMGKHEYLPNGNVLIVVPEEGRVLEVTAQGDKVMEFNNLATGSPENNVHIANGHWLPADYFEKTPSCP